MKRTSRTSIALLSALAVSTAPVALAASVTFLGLADAAYAKPGNGKGNGNGGGGRGDNGNRGGNSAAAKERAGAQTGGGRDGAGGRPATSQRGGGGVLEALGLKKRTVVVRRAPQNETRRAPQRSVTASPVPRAKPRAAGTAEDTDVIGGNSWKARLDGDLRTHPSELGAWNSARRSPVAIANMAEKYRETGEASGAGGMIGALVVAYEDQTTSVETLRAELDAAIEAGLIDATTANRLLAGTLSEQAIEGTLAAFEAETGALFVFDEASGTYSCDDGGGTAGDCSLVSAEDLDALNADLATLAGLDRGEGEYAALADALAARTEATDMLEAANASVQPNKSTDPEVQEAMLADVLDLLGLEVAEPEPFEISEEGDEELLPEDGLPDSEG